MESQWILSHQKNRVLTLTLNRPEVRNALSTDCLELLVKHLEQADNEDEIGAIVITGSPRFFAAGADLKELQQQTVASALADKRPQVWHRLSMISKPIITAANGYALGAGFELLLASDIIIAGESARFGLPEITLGLIPGAGGTQRLIRTVGKSLAMQMVLTGEPMSAKQALQAGLISEICVDELVLERAQKLAQRIANHAPLAVRAAKAVLVHSQENHLTEGLQLERQYFVALAGTDDRREGIEAFFEKRRPQFTGQ
ncbi:2,3-dehydroadipyl-CoA hydratase PaaF [Providencia sp. Me31A]|uniref:2,3-dehydroadipyl-CoA hydratase PaaF n=1 Tax=Providencia sp. Me31A TaxID=3392637 RepID=UPI003D2B924E